MTILLSILVAVIAQVQGLLNSGGDNICSNNTQYDLDRSYSDRTYNCTVKSCGDHGICVNGECQCNSGWSGVQCQKPLCEKVNHCSSAGYCVEPNKCRCYIGMSGDDCSLCVSPLCNRCAFRCVHGYCDVTTNECKCWNGWKGATCEVCYSSVCDVYPTVFFVFPSSIALKQSSALLSVYGTDFPAGETGRYTCIYGTVASEGRYISSALIRCTIPIEIKPGRYPVYVAPFGSNSMIPTFDNHSIFVTLFMSCSSFECEGICIGKMCVCPANREGDLCEKINIGTKLQVNITANESFTEVTEGTPYTVQLPMKDINVIYNVKSDIDNLSVSSSGLVVWQKPIGSETPYHITLNIETSSGESQINWNLTVKPTYTPQILKILRFKDSNQQIIQGKISTDNPNILAQAPVQLLIYRNSEEYVSCTTETDANGNFESTFYPFQQPSTYFAIAYHPGVTINSTNVTNSNQHLTWNDPEITVSFEESVIIPSSSSRSINTIYKIKGVTEKPVGCLVEVIFPRDKIQVTVYKEMTASNFNDMTTTLNASLTTATDSIGSFTAVMVLSCLNTVKQIIRQKFRSTSTQRLLIPDITELKIEYSPQTTPGIIPIRFFGNDIQHRSSWFTFRISPDNSPMFVVANESQLPLSDISQPILILYLSYRTDVISFGEMIHGNITVLDNDDNELASISYNWKATNSNFFNFIVYVQDEFTAMNLATEVQGAEVTLRNTENELNEQRRIIKNGNSVFFSVVEDLYELSVSSPIHQMVRLIVQPTSTNNTITVFLLLLSAEQPILYNGHLSLEKLYDHRNIPSPLLSFKPSVLTANTAVKNGYTLLQLYSSSNGSFAYFSGLNFNDTKSQFQITIQASDYALGSGDGYSSSYSLTTDLLSNNYSCNSYLLMIPYIYSMPGTKSNFVKHSPLIINLQKPDTEVKFCRADLEGQQESMAESVWQKTAVHCNCRSNERHYCRQKYSSVAVCGNSWRWILDSEVSYDSLAMFILLNANCNSAAVNFSSVIEFLKCLSNFEMKCVVPSTKSLPLIIQKSVNNIEEQNTFQMFLRQVSSVHDNFGSITKRFFSGFSALEGQAVSMLRFFLSFFSQLQQIFPPQIFDQITSRSWYDRFFATIAETSDGGPIITAEEYSILNTDNMSLDLINLWNSTVTRWSLSDLEPACGISFSAVRNLVATSAGLKLLAKQYGSSNPFALLHKSTAVILSESNEADFNNALLDDCAQAYLMLTPKVINEDENFFVKLKIKNEKNFPLSNLFVSLELVREHRDNNQIQFRVGPLTVSGISSIDGLNSLAADSLLDAQWAIKVVGNSRLVRTIRVKAVVTVQFFVNGKQTVQELEPEMITIVPRPSLTLRYLLMPEVRQNSPENGNFTASIDFINTGFSELRDITVEHCRMLITSINGSSSISFSINEIYLDNSERDKFNPNFVIPSINPGAVVRVKYKLSTTNTKIGRLRNLELFLSVANRVVHIDEPQVFYIQKVLSSHRLLLSSYLNPKLFYYYDVAKSTVHRILKPALIEVKDEKRAVDGTEYRKQIAKYEAVSADTTGAAYYLQLSIPKGMPDKYEILAICNTPTGSDYQRHIPLLNVLYEPNDEQMIYFIDEQPSYTEPELVYEFIYGIPDDFTAPVFEFQSYKIPIIKENWPNINASVARIAATSATNLRITFNMYTLDSSGTIFKIDPNTGDIILTEELPRTHRNYCFSVTAKDAAGRQTIMPVLISIDDYQNTDASECKVIDDISDAIPLQYSKHYQTLFTSAVISAVTSPSTTIVTSTNIEKIDAISVIPSAETSTVTDTTKSVLDTSEQLLSSENPSLTSVMPSDLQSSETSLFTDADAEITKLNSSATVVTEMSVVPLASEMFFTQKLPADTIVQETEGNIYPTTISAQLATVTADVSVPSLSTTAPASMESITTTIRLPTANTESITSTTTSSTDATYPTTRVETTVTTVMVPNVRTETTVVLTSPTPKSFISSSLNRPVLDDDSQMQSEIACRLKGTDSIWGLICDLSKTAQLYK